MFDGRRGRGSNEGAHITAKSFNCPKAHRQARDPLYTKNSTSFIKSQPNYIILYIDFNGISRYMGFRTFSSHSEGFEYLLSDVRRSIKLLDMVSDLGL